LKSPEPVYLLGYEIVRLFVRFDLKSTDFVTLAVVFIPLQAPNTIWHLIALPYSAFKTGIPLYYQQQQRQANFVQIETVRHLAYTTTSHMPFCLVTLNGVILNSGHSFGIDSDNVCLQLETQ
jgi:hypothetical protein